jgi:hypothetical protein
VWGVAGLLGLHSEDVSIVDSTNVRNIAIFETPIRLGGGDVSADDDGNAAAATPVDPPMC